MGRKTARPKNGIHVREFHRFFATPDWMPGIWIEEPEEQGKTKGDPEGEFSPESGFAVERWRCYRQPVTGQQASDEPYRNQRNGEPDRAVANEIEAHQQPDDKRGYQPGNQP